MSQTHFVLLPLAHPTANKECSSGQEVRPLPLQLPAHLQSHLPEDRLSPAILVRGKEGGSKRGRERKFSVGKGGVYLQCERRLERECDKAETEMRKKGSEGMGEDRCRGAMVQRR